VLIFFAPAGHDLFYLHADLFSAAIFPAQIFLYCHRDILFSLLKYFSTATVIYFTLTPYSPPLISACAHFLLLLAMIYLFAR
jgi:hypothetical protein